MPSERNYRLLAENLKNNGSLRFGGVVGSFGAYLAARFLEAFAPRQVLLISPDPERALVFQDNLKFFSAQLGLDCRFDFFPGSGALEGMVSRLVRLEEGERLRIYVPFGKRWRDYCLRRFRENPRILRHVTWALFRPES